MKHILEIFMIFNCSALAGAGKTYSAARWAITKSINEGMKIAFIQSSKRLIDQTFEDIDGVMGKDGAYVPVRRFYGRDGIGIGQSVRKEIMKHLNDTHDDGEIILMTHAAFLGLPYWHKQQLWTLVIDEIPQVDKMWDFKLSQTHYLITDHVAVNEFDPIHYQVSPLSEKVLTDYRRNLHNDEIYEKFKDLSACLLSPHWSVHVRKEQWHRHINGETEHGRHTLSFFSMLEPTIFEGYRDVIVMGAMFEDSLMNLYWSNQGVKFLTHKEISSGVRYQQHDNGELVSFIYLLEDDWSKRVRNLELDGKSLFDWSVEAIKRELRDKPFLWVANNDITDNELFGSNQRLPGVPNGLNEYQHIDHMVFLSALNRNPAHIAYLEAKGLDPEQVKFATGCQTAYQAFMRGSIRDPGNQKAKTCIVPDQRTAEYLARHFRGAKIGPLSGNMKVTKKQPGRKPKADALTNAQKQARKRANKTSEILGKLLHMKERQKSDTKNTIDIGNSGFVFNPTQLRHSWNSYVVNLFDSIYSAVPSFRMRMTNEEVIAEIKATHKTCTDKKTNNLLLSAADFNPDKSPETKRGMANIEYVNGIWLDNDGGDLTPDEFHRFFPDLRMVAFNTYSGGNRWRGFIPCTQIMTVEAHQIIIRSLERVVNQRGYWSDRQADEANRQGRTLLRHGFDTSKFVPSSLFYLPVQAKDGDSFLREWSGREIDPILWVERSIIHEKSEEAQTLEFEDDETTTKEVNSFDLDTVLGQISVKGRPIYQDWIRITWAAIKVAGKNDGIAAMEKNFPQEKGREYPVLASGWQEHKSPGKDFLINMAS
ncbi:DEAD/DEAH box helicase [Magnetovibrio blakemorei]|uniref:Uncharacterized protein n=1 Tax=Magnetovibrio blakemorei TaxID=28181 RepID=A0A1E5Q8D7_9PROT|nr:DEAD/DEAH box helicase [Magnetovibrio blakemorei]OEJ67627.1 hypothetical protein BEN30_09410 [Magnetovibrio blakemorei]